METSNDECIIDVSRFSKWTKLMRSMAVVIRFIKNLRSKQRGKLELDAFYETQMYLFRKSKEKSFKDAIKDMKQHRPLSKKDRLLCLSPFFENGLLRVCGRTKRSSLPFDAKHPIILDSKEHSILHTEMLWNLYAHWSGIHSQLYPTEMPHSWSQNLPEKFGLQMFRLSPLPSAGTTATDGRLARHSFPGNTVTSHHHQCRRGIPWTFCRSPSRCRSEDLHLPIHLFGYKSNSPGSCRGPPHRQLFDSN